MNKNMTSRFDYFSFYGLSTLCMLFNAETFWDFKNNCFSPSELIFTFRITIIFIDTSHTIYLRAVGGDD